MLAALTELPLVVIAAFQLLVIDWPLGQVQFTVQPVIAELPAVTVTVAWKPPVQLLSVCQVAVQPPGWPVGAMVGVAVGEIVPDGLTVGVAVGLMVPLGLTVAVGVGVPGGGVGPLPIAG
jgi:hypothetical protein